MVEAAATGGGPRLTGGCQCGAVRYTLTTTPVVTCLCHCRMCRKAGGSPFMAFTGVPLGAIEWQGRPTIFRSSTIAERGFCGTCGTPLTYRMLDAERISVTTASLDDPNAVPPNVQNGVEAKFAWTDGLRDLPTYRTDDWMREDLAKRFETRQSAGRPDV